MSGSYNGFFGLPGSFRPDWRRPLRRLTVSLMLVAGASMVGAPTADGAPADDAEVARLRARIARLEEELANQKKLLLNFMESEQQRYDLILQLMRANAGGAAPQAAIPAPTIPRVDATDDESQATQPTQERQPQRARHGTISGRVSLPEGISDAYVYVDGLSARRARRTNLHIVQKNKQFSPRVAVVAVGSQVSFPNRDSIFHNVFSTSRGNAFDLGGQKGGESKSVRLTRPGHVEIFCNIHSRMRADVLVVPNRHYAKVEPDGTFEIKGVPVGRRKVVLWAPGAKLTSETVSLDGDGAEVRLAANKAAIKPHMNKFGRAYGSYEQ